MSDYLAVIRVAGGGGSWARDKDRDQAIKRCARIFRTDWKHLIEFKKGKETKVNVINVSGYDEVWWDHRGFWSEVDGKRVDLDRPVDVVTHVY